MSSYAKNKKWRDAHRGTARYRAQRAAEKQRYRNRTGKGRGGLGRTREWTPQEDRLVLAHEMPDREIAELIGRSVNAVQHRRNRLKKGEA